MLETLYVTDLPFILVFLIIRLIFISRVDHSGREVPRAHTKRALIRYSEGERK